MGRGQIAGAMAVIALVALWLYGPMLAGGFVWDDFGYIEVFSKFETVGPIEALQWFWTERSWFAMATYRPVLELSYVYEWHLFGREPFGYRCSNLLMHVGSACLLAGLVWHWTRVRVAALAAGLLFVASPAHPESLGWLSSRVNLLATMWMLAALFAFVRGRTLLAAIATFLALGSKETAYVLPAMLSVYAWFAPADGIAVEAEPAPRGIGRRVVAVLRRTWVDWVLLGLVLALRHHTLGQWLGGYEWRAPPDFTSLAYLRERLDLLRVTLAPVHLARHPEIAVPIVAVGHTLMLGVLAAAALTARAAARCALPGRVAFVFAWFALANVPIYNAPFSERTVSVLESSRLLYEPTAALVAGFGIALAWIWPKPRIVIAGLWLAGYLWLAHGNLGPWVVVERLSAVISDFAATAGEDGPRRLVADLPASYDGAFLFPDKVPELNEFVHGGAAKKTIELARGVDGARTMAWILAARASDAGVAELWRAEFVAPRSARIVAEPIDRRFPLALGPHADVRYARVSRFHIRAGGDLELDLALTMRAGAGHAPLGLRIVDVGDGHVVDRFVRGAAEAEGEFVQRVVLPLRIDIAVGRPLRLELELDGVVGALAEFEVSPSERSW